ncbi:MAG: DUF2784 domain-containing protein [Sciscionella sp.]
MWADIADAVVVFVHYAVMAYIVFGGFLIWRLRWTVVPHVAIIGWAVLSLLYPVVCPLTSLENYFRRLSGHGQLDGGFIKTYITDVLYPAQYEFYVQLLCALIVVISWSGAYLHWKHHRMPAASAPMDRVTLG